MPLIAGLYHRPAIWQSFTADGQHEIYPSLDQYCRCVCPPDANGSSAGFQVAPGRQRRVARPDLAQVSRAPLLCWDSDIPENEHTCATSPTALRWRPGTSHQTRDPGRGGRIAAYTGPSSSHPGPEVSHMNEGHAGFE